MPRIDIVMKRTGEKEHGYRTAVVPVTLGGAAYRQAHQGCHNAALIWNELVAFQHQFWNIEHADPGWKMFYAHLAGLDSELRVLHSQSMQAIVADLEDAVTTYRANRRQGIKSRAPWRLKQYRPLSFTTQGWRVTAAGRLFLSMGRGRAPILLPLPQITDPKTKELVEPRYWGEIRLCWDIQARRFSLHIAVPTQKPVALDPGKTIAIDPGIINPMTLAVATNTGFAVTVINGRAARAIKHRRNTTVAALTRKMSKAEKHSRRWQKLDRAKKRASAKATAALRNIDHQVSRKAANLAISHNAGDIVIGDVRGIEKATKQAEKRRFGRHQRRRLSQWSRGRQEQYLAEKTGTGLRRINEAYSSKTCPACLTRNRPSGRNYQCRGCGFACHRDAVGAINILMRATHGNYTRIDPDAIIEVTYLRATPLTVPARSTAQNRARTTTTGGPVADNHRARHAVTPHQRLTGRKAAAPTVRAHDQKPRP